SRDWSSDVCSSDLFEAACLIADARHIVLIARCRQAVERSDATHLRDPTARLRIDEIQIAALNIDTHSYLSFREKRLRGQPETTKGAEAPSARNLVSVSSYEPRSTQNSTVKPKR